MTTKFRDRKYHPHHLGRLVRCAVRRYWPFARTDFIAVTGSCGKTSATLFLGRILRAQAPCFIGIDYNCKKVILKNMLKVRYSDRYCLLETGIDEPGDMARNVAVMRPNIGIVTTIGQDHYTNFRTLEATAAEKGILIEKLPKSGTAVLNADDPHVLAMRRRTRARVLTYGCADTAGLRAGDITADWPRRLAFTAICGNESARIQTALFSDLLLPSVLAALAGALAAGIPLAQAAAALDKVEAYPRRMSIHGTGGGVWFIDDSFKSPLWGVAKVIETMRRAQAPRKTIVIGAFSDTPGADSPKYRRAARHSLEVADRVIMVGKKAHYMRKLQCPELENRLFAFAELRDAARLLRQDIVPGELVMLKSNSNDHLERLIHAMDHDFACWIPECKAQIHCKTCPTASQPLPEAVPS